MINKIKIKSGKVHKTIGGKDVFVVAEIGKNFIRTKEERPVGEYMRNAKELINAAAEAGVDAVKFQTHELDDEQLNIPIVAPHFSGSDRYAWVKRNTEATPIEFWRELKKYSENHGLVFFSTPMSRKAAEKLNNVNVPIWKIASGDMRDYVLLDYMIETGKPMIISSGQVSLAELDDIVEKIRARGGQFAVLYCVSHYPCPREYFNLATLEHFKEKYPEAVIGFSDHSLGKEVSLAAVTMGAQIIEKHFSMSRRLWGADHKVSMTPSEMKSLVKAIRSERYKKVDHLLYYGSKEKELEGANNHMRPYFGKTLVASRDIPKGTILTKDMVYAMRPMMLVKGLPSDKYFDILGRKTKISIKRYQPITTRALKMDSRGIN